MNRTSYRRADGLRAQEVGHWSQKVWVRDKALPKRGSLPSPAPNNRLQPTPYSLVSL
jgi:hypothetical protein